MALSPARRRVLVVTALLAVAAALLAVPAHQWMWSAHDVVNHHHRRYSKGTLTAAIEAAGLKARKMHWFNSLLFPLAAAARIAGRLTGKDDSDDSPPAKPLNAAFEAIFRLERHLVGRVPLTPGVSIVTLAEPGAEPKPR